MPIEKIFELIAAGGPSAIALIMALIAYKLNEERKEHVKTITAMHAEKEAMFREWKEEYDAIRERILTALSNATIAVSTGSANMDSMKQTLQVLTAYVSRRGDDDRRAG